MNVWVEYWKKEDEEKLEEMKSRRFFSTRAEALEFAATLWKTQEVRSRICEDNTSGQQTG
jgi:putative SOS response-associated peptidase YedK|tara:strand:- start:148 stop:327 length:180 start_codon:yes stop_codon:yes gene_type:complete